MKLSSLLKRELPELLLFFFNVTQKGKDFSLEGSFKQSKFSTMTYHKETLLIDLANRLSDFYNLDFESTGSKVELIIENDLAYSFDEMIQRLRTRIAYEMATFSSLSTLDGMVALAATILRGSPDFNRHYIALDIKRVNETEEYLDSLTRILMSTKDLARYINWNFRDFQTQFITGENQRNTQLRFNMRWFYDTLLGYYKKLHPYKYNILYSNRDNLGALPQTSTLYQTFMNRITYYREKVLGQSISATARNAMRNELFGETDGISGPTRNQQVKMYIKNSTVDVCSACGELYPTDERSFLMPVDDRYYFEYHHVISYSNDREGLDIPENLVKLCPTCHRAMTPGRAHNELQKELIGNIIHNRDDVFEFTKLYLNTVDESDTIEKIHSLLR
jgi:5-methylcytosine-specific restriction protein A